jgi:uncharacterized membrane protein YfcA
MEEIPTENAKAGEVDARPIKKFGIGSYITMGLLWVFAKSFSKSDVDELVVLVIVIIAGIFYYRLKSKIRIKNNTIAAVVTFFILEIISGFLIGFLTTIF